MVDEQIIGRGIHDDNVITAMRLVPRHEFVLKEDINSAYEDYPLTIGYGQTISQPYMVALMTEALGLTKNDVVLEVGTGSGYQTAVLAELCREVYSIERISALAERAKIILDKLHYKNIHAKIGDGSVGCGEGILFDAIIVTAYAPSPLKNLLPQLQEGGRMVVPIGDSSNQVLTLIKKEKNVVTTKEICRCIFVPLIGKFGWSTTA